MLHMPTDPPAADAGLATWLDGAQARTPTVDGIAATQPCDQRPLLRLWPAVLARMRRAARTGREAAPGQFSDRSADTRDSIVDSSAR